MAGNELDKELEEEVSDFIDEVYQVTMRSYLIERKRGNHARCERLLDIIERHIKRDIKNGSFT